ncbi:hypothetical protein Clacol_009904 [Clathrus columnatus]|uniref:MRG-binding protein n=1 Tax=Clathrus columnatus TaxID=1419009 RepID=A0AAV5AS67_9AGAM|nr:hypothetical protein Clacol_009904 [Clathrus columnatus]
MADEEKPVLETVPGEISFFKSITRHRPVGIHRYFHILSMQQVIKRETGIFVPVDNIWEKLEACYNLDALEGLEIEGYDSSDSDASHPHSIPSPQPGENLMRHPFFRSEFQLPWNEYDSIMAIRRVSDLSPPASPTPGRRRGRRKSTQNTDLTVPSRRGSMTAAGLYGGDSESSALTDSGDDTMEVDAGSSKPSRRNSVMTGTPTDVLDDEDGEMDSPASIRGKRGRRRGTPATRKTSTPGRRGRRRGG